MVNITSFEDFLAAVQAHNDATPEAASGSWVYTLHEPQYMSIAANSHGHRDHRAPHYIPPSQSDPNVSWNGMFHLLLLSMVSTAGAMGTIFVVCAITVIDTLQVRGNVYLVSLAFGHLLVTLFVLPASCVTIMARIPNDPLICHYQWLATVACLVVSVLSFMFMALENFAGLGSHINYNLCCTKFRIVFIVFLIWFISIGVTLYQHVNNFGPNFCQPIGPSKAVLLAYHSSVGGALVLFPTLVTICFYTLSMFKLKRFKSQREASTGESLSYPLTDECLLNSNVAVYCVSFLMWAPLCVVGAISTFKPVTQDILNMSWWLALSNSCLYSFIYAFTNRDFGEAFFKLFYYCCCKSHVTFARKGAGPRRGFGDPMGVRTHMIPGMNMYSSRDGAGRGGGMGGFGMVGMGGGRSGTTGGGLFGRAFHSRAAGTKACSDL